MRTSGRVELKGIEIEAIDSPGQPGREGDNMDEIKLKPCPFCRRMPKVRYRAFGCCGAWVEVRCKPLFRREHLAVQHGAALTERAVDMAAEDWNRRADNG